MTTTTPENEPQPVKTTETVTEPVTLEPVEPVEGDGTESTDFVEGVRVVEPDARRDE